REIMLEQIISSGRGLKQRIGAIPQRINDLMDDPTLGPMLLLAALMSFGFIYLRRSQSINPKEGAILSQSNTEVTNATLGCKMVNGWVGFVG
ncbi:hypothetical protein Tco_0333650, partial [Tanacetum coccineum]